LDREVARPIVSDDPPSGPVVLGPRDKKCAGVYRGTNIRPGLALVIADLLYSDDATYLHECSGELKFHFKLSGDAVISGEGSDPVSVDAGVMSFLVQPVESWKREWVLAESHERSVTLVCSRDYVAEALLPSIGQLPCSIAEFLHAPPSHFSYGSVPLPLQVRPVIEELLNPLQTGKLGAIMTEVKALELFCFACNEMLKVSTAPGGVRSKDYKKVQDLCAILDDMNSPPLNISDLSRLLAWNESQMMEAFKHVTGSTIFNYRHRARMDQAMRQLRETDISITQIAYDAGYEHPSNFATAFKRTYGFSPRLTRSRAI
jgi:AraC-like DNA-binding protein